MKIRLPELVRQFCAEVLGTFLLVLFGDGAIAQVVLGKHNNLERKYCRKKYLVIVKGGILFFPFVSMI